MSINQPFRFCLTLVPALLVLCAQPLLAQPDACSVTVSNEVFCDDFSDGDYADGMPVTWTFLDGIGVAGMADASSGELVIRQPNADPQVMYIDDLPLTNMSIRSPVRQVGGSGPIAVYGRLDPDNLTGYQGGIDTNDNTIYLARNDAPTPVVLRFEPTELNPSVEDVVLQLDISGNDLSLFAWRANETKPALPSLKVTDTSYGSGFPALLIDSPASHVVAFSHVRVATTSIPEPSSSLLCFCSIGLMAMWRRRRARR